VILASRIAPKAPAGEDPRAESVWGLLSGKGFVFGDRGEFVPKGFDERTAHTLDVLLIRWSQVRILPGVPRPQRAWRR
jgi:hypothetical protein